MKDTFALIPWAAWVTLTSITGSFDFLKKLVGKKEKTAALETKIEALEKRVAQLDEKNSEALSAK